MIGLYNNGCLKNQVVTCFAMQSGLASFYRERDDINKIKPKKAHLHNVNNFVERKGILRLKCLGGMQKFLAACFYFQQGFNHRNH